MQTVTEFSKSDTKRYWLVGGSEGIGLELVKLLLAENHQVVVSARNAESNHNLLSLQRQYPKTLMLLDCDVRQTDCLADKTHQAWSFFNGLDGWIYNAGVYHPMTLDEWDIAAFESMNQVNYLGAVHLMNLLLPYFKTKLKSKDLIESQSPPLWLWNISLASDFGLPYGGGYSAPKAALQNLAESLKPELEQSGIELKVVNHGFVKTRLTAQNDFAMLGLMTPKDAAQKLLKALYSPNFESRFPFNLAFVLGLIKRLPKSWALAITKRMLKNG
ncbi:short-chain dehydrogenase [Thiomicrorhabdus immobilis]|uniref:Short-chain dehydrogenase n=1 Tax=Thiomicrorhabdus immobilis TaxID=2791037 RepID=A0ABM7MFR0_9GAMM|nr:SDR family NAD(P)-dependent oxidoreductase [Thiomicrorhabdus immobilis]BCN94361.1 short-chain dehydrogenase [Thiomicrorhabdus immobilis]